MIFLITAAEEKAGNEVAVKIQRPGIRKTIEIDMEIIFHIAMLMEKYVEGMKIHQPTQVVKEFACTFEKEIDYSFPHGTLLLAIHQ